MGVLRAVVGKQAWEIGERKYKRIHPVSLRLPEGDADYLRSRFHQVVEEVRREVRAGKDISRYICTPEDAVEEDDQIKGFYILIETLHLPDGPGIRILMVEAVEVQEAVEWGEPISKETILFKDYISFDEVGRMARPGQGRPIQWVIKRVVVHCPHHPYGVDPEWYTCVQCKWHRRVPGERRSVCLYWDETEREVDK